MNVKKEVAEVMVEELRMDDLGYEVWFSGVDIEEERGNEFDRNGWKS